jgi:hypothetical protein
MKKKKSSSKSLWKNAKKSHGGIGSGNIYIVAILATMGFVGFALVGGGLPETRTTAPNSPVIILTPKPDGAKNNLQLQTFGYITPLPTPAAAASLCQNGNINNEPEILVYPNEQTPTITVASGGQVKVWVNDEGAPFISQNEQVDLSTGQIITPGDRGAKAPDNYLWEPALYVSPATAESGGQPHFPTAVKGQFSNTPGVRSPGVKGAPIDPVPSGAIAQVEDYTAEYIWDVSSLGLSAGSYQAEFVIHDGDRDRGVGCYTLQVQ